MCLNKLQFILCGVLFAVVAMKFDVAFGVFNDRKFGRDVVLFVGDAVRVEAFHDVLDAFRKRNCLFLNHFVIFDLDD